MTNTEISAFHPDLRRNKISESEFSMGWEFHFSSSSTSYAHRCVALICQACRWQQTSKIVCSLSRTDMQNPVYFQGKEIQLLEKYYYTEIPGGK